MSLLALDISNSHTTLGIFKGDELTAHWTVASDIRRTSDEWYLVLQGLVTRTTLAEVTAVSVCCTVPSILVEIRAMIDRYYAEAPVSIVGPGVKTGVPINTDNPREVGADRVVNALAAASLYDGPAIVVDFGTATTFDVVSARGEYVGGAIAPGIDISLEALGRRGAQLRRVELLRPRTVIAKNTVEALQSGVLYGFASLVDGIVDRMTEELGLSEGDLSVIATGGLAPLVVEECAVFTEHQPWLTLLGLEIVFGRNRPDA